MKNLVEQLWSELKSQVGNIVYMDAVDSSHAMAVRLISQMDEESMALDPTLVLVYSQSQGRGRGGRSWSSPGGGLYLNWLSSDLDRQRISQMPMLAAAAAHLVVSQLGIAGLGIKWPNDLLMNGKKLAGLLVHARQGEMVWTTVGLGINLDQTPKLADPGPHPPTSLAEHLPPESWKTWVHKITTGFISQLLRNLAEPDSALAHWRKSLIHSPGEEMSVRLGSGSIEHGTFVGLTSEGFLRLRGERGEQVITSGDVVETIESVEAG